MKNNKTIAWMSIALAILTLASAVWKFARAPVVHASGEPIVVIVNSGNPIENLTIGELKKLFLSDRSRWDTGKAVAPVIMAAGTPERTSFLKIVCGMNDAEFGKYFLQAAFTGKNATPPKDVSTAQGVKATVASAPGAIGFIRAADFHGDGSDGGIKAVKVEGLEASDPGYKIRM